MTTAIPHFEQVPRLPASAACTMIRWPLEHLNVIDPAGGFAGDRGTILVFSSDIAANPCETAGLHLRPGTTFSRYIYCSVRTSALTAGGRPLTLPGLQGGVATPRTVCLD